MAKKPGMTDSAASAYMWDNSKSGGKMPKDNKKPAPAAKKPAAPSAPKYQKPEPVKPAVKKVTSAGSTGSKGGRMPSVKATPKPVAKKPSRSMIGK